MTTAAVARAPAPPAPSRWSHAAFGLRLMAVAAMAEVLQRMTGEIFGLVAINRLRASGAVPSFIGYLVWNDRLRTVTAAAGLLGAALLTRVPRETGAAESARASFLATVVSAGVIAASSQVMEMLTRRATPTILSQMQSVSAVLALVGGVVWAAALVFLVVAVVRALRAVGSVVPRWAPALPFVCILSRGVDFALPGITSVMMLSRPTPAWTVLGLQCAVDLAVAVALTVFLWGSAAVLARRARKA